MRIAGTIFTPASPKTKPKLEKVERYESFSDFDELIERAVKNREVYIFPKKEQPKDKFAEFIKNLRI
ncbi:putative tRNA sulfurtransferase OS=Lysinibacillus sphaericus OX=1421 GN=thiI PE=3 SV=1 [Lysinibacillus sphaericus]